MPAKVEDNTVTGKYPCSSKKGNVGSKEAALLALKCWRSFGAAEPLSPVQALKPFLPILQGPSHGLLLCSE